MNERKVIKRGELPIRLPISGTVLAYLLLDKFQAPSWLWGAAGVIYLLIWIGVISALGNEKETSVLGSK